MSVTSSFPMPLPGQWTSIAQYNEQRRSMIVCVIGSDVILSMSKASPDAVGPVDLCKGGIYLEGGQNGVPTIFRLSEEIDGNMVHQEWFAYPFPALAPPILQYGINTNRLPVDHWTVPDGIVQVNQMWLFGYAGTAPLDPFLAPRGGGGGGANSHVGVLSATAGEVWTFGLDVYPNPTLSWVKNGSGTKVLQAECGKSSNSATGALGGTIALGIGDVFHSGGNGADADVVAGNGGGGGGGGGTTGNGGNAVGTTGGAAGTGVPAGIPLAAGAGGAGGLPGFSGGAAGNPSGGAGGSGLNGGGPNTGGLSYTIIEYTVQLPSTDSPVIAVYESFDTPDLDGATDKTKESQLSVPMPRLTRKGVRALQDLLARATGQEDDDATMQDEAEHDNPDNRDDAGGDSGAESEP